MEDDLKKMKMEDDLNFKAVLLRLFNNKNLKNKWFDTIEIDLVLTLYTRFLPHYPYLGLASCSGFSGPML